MSGAYPAVRLRRLAQFNPAVPEAVASDPDHEWPLLPMEQIGNFAPPTVRQQRSYKTLSTGYSYLEQTDLAYAKVTPCFENGKGLIGADLEGPTFATTEVTVLRPNPGMSQRFLAYIMQSEDFRAAAIASMTGAGGLRRVSESDMKNFRVPAPDLADQSQIADYLDHETAELDQFVNLHSRFRKLLRERRSNTVKARVTRGLSVDAELRLSRDPSIGDYPATWRETRLKFIGKSIIGVTYSPEGLVDESHDGVNVLRSGNIQNGHLVSADMVRISQPVPTNLRIREGDILLCARNGSADLVGKNALASKDFFGDTWGAFMVVFRSPHFRFLSWFFNTDTFKSRIGGFSTTTINQLTSKDLGNSLIALPPEAEQAQISNLLDQETAVIDDLITDSALATALARERRAALITAAVTGQIDVTARHKPVAEQLEDDIAQGLHREN